MDNLLPEKLKKARKKKGYTQAYVAGQLDIEIGTLSGYERGYRRPSAELLAKLAELYNVPVDFLLGRVYKGKKEFADFQMVLRDDYGDVAVEVLKLLKQLDEKEQYKAVGYLERMVEQKK